MTQQVHPNVVARNAAEKKGGWLLLYIEAERCCISGATVRCYYCGYGVKEGHDDDCLYIANCYELQEAGHIRGGGPHHYEPGAEIFVPEGGLKRRLYSHPAYAG